MKPHLRGVLDAQVPQAAQPKHRDDVARARAGVAQGVERRHPRTQERRGVDWRQFGGQPRHRAGRGDHVLGRSRRRK